MKPITLSLLATVGTLMFATPAVATQLTYVPVNPSFGGSPLNASMLLSKAQLQNTHTAPTTAKTYDQTFQESLQRSYLNKLIGEITDFAFGDADEDNPLNNGDFSFQSGDYTVDIIASDSETVTVTITGTDGSETIIVLDKTGD